jgi:hypothetical protein
LEVTLAAGGGNGCARAFGCWQWVWCGQASLERASLLIERSLAELGASPIGPYLGEVLQARRRRQHQ